MPGLMKIQKRKIIETIYIDKHTHICIYFKNIYSNWELHRETEKERETYTHTYIDRDTYIDR